MRFNQIRALKYQRRKLRYALLADGDKKIKKWVSVIVPLRRR